MYVSLSFYFIFYHQHPGTNPEVQNIFHIHSYVHLRTELAEFMALLSIIFLALTEFQERVLEMSSL